MGKKRKQLLNKRREKGIDMLLLLLLVFQFGLTGGDKLLFIDSFQLKLTFTVSNEKK